jgi:GH15 family glucan-1,4-alpha-glucosidase
LHKAKRQEFQPNNEQLGNFSQAFSHVGLITAAYQLDRAIDPS